MLWHPINAPRVCRSCTKVLLNVNLNLMTRLLNAIGYSDVDQFQHLSNALRLGNLFPYESSIQPGEPE